LYLLLEAKNYLVSGGFSGRVGLTIVHWCIHFFLYGVDWSFFYGYFIRVRKYRKNIFLESVLLLDSYL
jgi:hypothetical protein